MVVVNEKISPWINGQWYGEVVKLTKTELYIRPVFIPPGSSWNLRLVDTYDSQNGIFLTFDDHVASDDNR